MTVRAGSSARKHRLTRPSEFKRVFASRQRAVEGPFVVLALPNGLDLARLGIALPRRRFRTAVERNRVKRMVRETFREHRDVLKGLDVVVMVKKTARPGALADSRTVLSRMWAKVPRCETS